jgi:hypothetical protein
VLFFPELVLRERIAVVSDASMRDSFIQPAQETFSAVEKYRRWVLEAAKPYLTAFLIVTLLLTVWAGLCAA